MSYRLIATPVALILLSGAAVAQDTPRTVGISVAGAVVEVSVDVAAEACGIDAETLLAEWETLGAEVSTMADTSVNADATDISPDVAVDTPMDATVDGESVADGADATSEADGDAAVDVASDAGEATEAGTVTSGGELATADAATSEEVAVAGTDQEGTDGPATPTEGTDLAKAAVCEVSQETADGLGIVAALSE